MSAFASARRHAFVDDPLSPLAALGALLLAGLLYGILLMVRLSPVGPGLAGMVLFGLSAWAMAAPAAYDSSFDGLNVHMGGAVGQSGLGFLLGVPLIATLTSPRRWRSAPHPAPYYGPAPSAYAPSTVDATLQMPMRPAYLTVPEVAPPSLHYPAVAPVVQQSPTPFTPPAAPVVQQSPTPFTPPAAPVVQQSPTPFTPPAAPVVQQSPTPFTPPAAPAPQPPAAYERDKAVKIDLDGDEPTVKMEP